MTYPLQVQLCMDTYAVRSFLSNDVVVRVLDLLVYYFVIRVDMHVGHNSKIYY